MCQYRRGYMVTKTRLVKLLMHANLTIILAKLKTIHLNIQRFHKNGSELFWVIHQQWKQRQEVLYYIPATFCNNSMRHFVKFFLFFGWSFNPINEDTALWGRRFWTRERHEYLFDFPNVRKSSIFFQFYFLLLKNPYNNFIPASWQLRILFYRLVPSIFCKALGIAATKSFYVGIFTFCLSKKYFF